MSRPKKGMDDYLFGRGVDLSFPFDDEDVKDK